MKLSSIQEACDFFIGNIGLLDVDKQDLYVSRTISIVHIIFWILMYLSWIAVDFDIYKFWYFDLFFLTCIAIVEFIRIYVVSGLEVVMKM